MTYKPEAAGAADAAVNKDYANALVEAGNLSDIALRDQIEVLEKNPPQFTDSGSGDVSQAHADMGAEMIAHEQRLAAFKKVLGDREAGA